MIEALQKIPVTSRWLKTRKRPSLTSGEQRLPRGVFPGAAAVAPEMGPRLEDLIHLLGWHIAVSFRESCS